MTRTRGQHGFTMIELMISLSLGTLIVLFLLSITRAQLSTFEENSNVRAVQMNTRAGLDFVESLLRRACAGISDSGVVVATGATNFGSTCVKVWDGAAASGSTFTSSAPLSQEDAVEVIFADGQANTLVTATPTGASVPVADTRGFQTGDFVLLGDKNGHGEVVLMKILNGAGGTGAVTWTMSQSVPTATFVTVDTGSLVMKARSVSLYVDSTIDPSTKFLMFDPDGVAGADHSDAQPLVDGVEDFQVSIGDDGFTGTTPDGVIAENLVTPSADEWIGNDPLDYPAFYLLTAHPGAAGGIADTLPSRAPWNHTSPGTSVLRTVRASLVLRTLNSYPGMGPVVAPLEDRNTWTAPSVGATSGPRYRQVRLVIAPRAWNLGE
jgi:prepilin-type N-terminal cleavage/methylation domain-containing protein